MLEEIERFLDRSPAKPPVGTLDLILDELDRTPRDPHLLRLLSRLHELEGNAAQPGVSHALQPSDAPASQSVEDQLALARLLVAAGLSAEAEACVQAALAAEPISLTALSLQAKICHLQGRLTETVALWHQQASLAPYRESALFQLAMLHRLAQDDEQVRMRFAAVAEDLTARKHPAQVALEKAFGRFMRREFGDALAGCDQVAARWHKEMPAFYKLAVLQRAWFQERMDDLDGARRTLQRLGHERGFETDIDRLGFLARVCERIDNRSAQEQALNIYEHLDLQYGKLTALPHIAGLRAQLGDRAGAANATREYERRFSRRMHQPSFAEAVRTLMQAYVPLERLPRLPPEEAGAAGAAGGRGEWSGAMLATRRRRRALIAFLCGDAAQAQRIFARLALSRTAAPLDLAYLGDLCAMAGEEKRARALWVEAIRRGEIDSAPLWRKAAPGAAELPASLLERGRALLAAAALREHSDAGIWHDLALLERALGLFADSQRHEEKARAIAAAPSLPRPGRVLVAAVYSVFGKPRGLMHEMTVSRRPAASGALETVLGNAPPDFRAGAVQIAATALDYARAHWPHLARNAGEFAYTLKIAKDDEPSMGTSAGLPIALAFLSLILDRPLPADVAASGALVCDSQREVAVRRIGDAIFKVKGAVHMNLRALVLPAENRENVERGDAVPQSISLGLVRYARNLDEAVEAVWGAEAWEW
jgi:tetratricopeptide (TPR) repeat protein